MKAKGSNTGPAVAAYFLFKTLPTLVSALAIYLGYRLFILGVTGQASLSFDAKTVKGQLLNAAPGLFFAVGGIVALIVIVIKGVQIELNDKGVPTGEHDMVFRALQGRKHGQ